MIVLSILLVAIISFVSTIIVRKMALQKNQLDIPNERSSHISPTPRGAGIAIVIAFCVGILVLCLNDTVTSRVLFSLVLPGLIVAIIGRLDDLTLVTSAKWRLIGHFICAIAAVWLVGGLPALPLFESTIDFGVAGDITAVIYLVWMLNLFNFMDGIDLITGIQTLSTSVAIAVFLFMKSESDLWAVFAVLAAAVVGFLYFNLPPAKIFLGDVGSGFIGFTLGAISLVVAKDEPLIAWSTIILLGVFVTDATVTLLRRLISLERVYIAHRTHAYQHMSKKINRHLPISLSVGAINIFFLLPIAWLVAEAKLLPLVGVLLAYVPLAGAALLLGAGKKIN